MTLLKITAGVYETVNNGKMQYRIYKNRYNGWTLAIFSERHMQFIDSRYFATLKQAKNAIL